MGITRITVVTCAGGQIEEIMKAMIEMAERYQCNVEANLNGTPLIVGPSRVHDLMRIFQFQRDSKQ